MDKKNIAVGDFVKIDIKACKEYCAYHPNWLALVKREIKNSDNRMPYVAEINDNDTIDIRSWEGNFLGDITIPCDAVVAIEKGNKQ